MSDDPTEGWSRPRLDVVFVRCLAALALAVTSLVLVIGDRPLSLLPLVGSLGLLTNGARMARRHEPPITFLVMVPVIAAIVVILVRR